MPGAYPYKLPSKSSVVEGTAVESKYSKSIFNEQTKKYEEIEATSKLGTTYKGGVIQGWNLYAPEKSKFILYDNAEKAEGANYGEVSINKEESLRDWFGSNGLKFKTALYYELIEGKVEGPIFLDIE